MNHTNEPWNPGFFVGDGFNICADADGRVIGVIKREEDRRRIVACVNACGGIPTEEVENDVAAGGYSARCRPSRIAEVEKQRDELLAALETISHWHGEDRFDALIAKAKGGAT